MKPPASFTRHSARPGTSEPGESWVTRAIGRCFGYLREAPAPADLADSVTVLGISAARFWADSQGKLLTREAERALEREEEFLQEQEGWNGTLPPANYLAISGGSDDGAFGAGLICGWSDAGTVPNFKLVTGVSTGAMIAPFAFLGRSYMSGLRAVYTEIGPDNVLKRRGVHNAIFGEALADTTPLYHLITHYINDRAIADIATEYNRGRLLLIGTASLDAQRPVIWNIGAIAASGRPGALELICKIILASASIPGAFPPMMIDVCAHGRHYQEMNVDGGVVAQTFLYPPNVATRRDFEAAHITRERHAYIIRNSRLDPDWASVNRRFLNISGRAIATMIHYMGYNDLLRIYAQAVRDGIDYNLAYIEPDFPKTKHRKFDPEYMNAMFAHGYAKGFHGFRWHKSPPVLEMTPDQ